jgi:hypothetical protein
VAVLEVDNLDKRQIMTIPSFKDFILKTLSSTWGLTEIKGEDSLLEIYTSKMVSLSMTREAVVMFAEQHRFSISDEDTNLCSFRLVNVQQNVECAIIFTAISTEHPYLIAVSIVE